MTTEMGIVFGVLAVTIALFTTDWLRLDLVALLAVLALMLTGVLEPKEALAGFADPLVLIIAGLFVVGAGLFRTGVAGILGTWLGRIAGTNPTRMLVTIMVAVGVLSAFMSSTGTVAILLPVVVALAHKARVSPSKLLMPMAFASLLGGMLTLIGTPPNIVVSEQLRAQGQPEFGFFSFTPLGLVMLTLGIGFMVLIGRRWLPDRTTPEDESQSKDGTAVSVEELAASYGLPGNLFQLRVRDDAPVVGKTVMDSRVAAQYQVTVLEMSNPEQEASSEAASPAAAPHCRFDPGELVLVYGLPDNVERFATERGLEILPEEMTREVPLGEATGMAEVLLTPKSALVGHTLAEIGFRDRYDLSVMSVLRLGKPLGSALPTTTLRFGDTLLVQGCWKRIRALRKHQRDFVVIGEPPEAGAAKKAPWKPYVSVGIMLAMLVVMTAGWLPTVTTVLLAAVAMVVTQCLPMEEAYDTMSWQSLVLIAAMLPMATALKKTGGIELVVAGLTGSLGHFGPIAMMAALFLLTSLFSQFISNTATTVLVAPIAFQAASTMEVSPRTFLMTVAIAASTAFATPIASPVNTLVLSPGGYRFSDYTRAGVGMQIVLMIATLLLVPLVFPLH
jgi:di/tricarboxylate transporter